MVARGPRDYLFLRASWEVTYETRDTHTVNSRMEEFFQVMRESRSGSEWSRLKGRKNALVPIKRPSLTKR